MKDTRSFWLVAVLCAAAGLTGGARDVGFPSAAAQVDPRPNVIIILVDDMGWSDIG